MNVRGQLIFGGQLTAEPQVLDLGVQSVQSDASRVTCAQVGVGCGTTDDLDRVDTDIERGAFLLRFGRLGCGCWCWLGRGCWCDGGLHLACGGDHLLRCSSLYLARR